MQCAKLWQASIKKKCELMVPGFEYHSKRLPLKKNYYFLKNSAFWNSGGRINLDNDMKPWKTSMYNNTLMFDGFLNRKSNIYSQNLRIFSLRWLTIFVIFFHDWSMNFSSYFLAADTSNSQFSCYFPRMIGKFHGFFL